MKSDAPIIIYLSNGKIAEQLKKEHPSIYSWVFPRSALPIGSMLKVGATPCQSHIILFAEDEYGGIKVGDMYDCFSACDQYIKDMELNEDDIAITDELYQIIKQRDYIKE